MDTEEAAALGLYVDGQNKLAATVKDRDKLLLRLEALAHASEAYDGKRSILDFNLAEAQDIMTQLTTIGANISALVIGINANAAKCNRPHVEIIRR